MTTEQGKAIDAVVHQLRRQYGDAAIATGTSYPTQAVTPTGLHYLDETIGGGVPQGRIIEIYGEAASGKTTLALLLARSVTGPTLYIDADAAFSISCLFNAGCRGGI